MIQAVERAGCGENVLLDLRSFFSPPPVFEALPPARRVFLILRLVARDVRDDSHCELPATSEMVYRSKPASKQTIQACQMVYQRIEQKPQKRDGPHRNASGIRLSGFSTTLPQLCCLGITASRIDLMDKYQFLLPLAQRSVKRTPGAPPSVPLFHRTGGRVARTCPVSGTAPPAE